MNLVTFLFNNYIICFKKFLENNRVLKGDSTSRTSFKRFAKGNVAIKEISPSNNYIVIENTSHSKDENISEWILKRLIDNGKKELFFTFPKNLVIEPLKSVKVKLIIFFI